MDDSQLEVTFESTHAAPGHTVVPCVATVTANHQETRSRQWKEFSAVLSMAISCTGVPSDFQDIEEQAL